MDLIAGCVSAVCPGTQNGLSSTGSQENQYNLNKDRYNGCEIIMGNLEITQIESNWDFSFLKVKTAIFHRLLSGPVPFNWIYSPCRPSVRWLDMSSSQWITFRRFLWDNCESSEETAFTRGDLPSPSSWTTPRTAPVAWTSSGSWI